MDKTNRRWLITNHNLFTKVNSTNEPHDRNSKTIFAYLFSMILPRRLKKNTFQIIYTYMNIEGYIYLSVRTIAATFHTFN